MKKWLILSGFIVAFAIGSISSGFFFPAKDNYSGFNDAMYNRGGEGHMMHAGHGPEMMNRMGNPNGMHGMGYSGEMHMMGDSREIPRHMMDNWNGNHMRMMGNMHGNAMYGHMSMMHGMMDDFLGAAAEALEMPADQLQSELQSGKSLAAIAEQKGLMKEELIEKLEDAAVRHLERFKQEGGLSAAEQERMLVYMRENIDMMVDAPGMFGCYGHGMSNYPFD